MRAFKWIPRWQDLDDFQNFLSFCALDESSLSIKRDINLYMYLAFRDLVDTPSKGDKTSGLFTEEIMSHWCATRQGFNHAEPSASIFSGVGQTDRQHQPATTTTGARNQKHKRTILPPRQTSRARKQVSDAVDTMLHPSLWLDDHLSPGSPMSLTVNQSSWVKRPVNYDPARCGEVSAEKTGLWGESFSPPELSAELGGHLTIFSLGDFNPTLQCCPLKLWERWKKNRLLSEWEYSSWTLLKFFPLCVTILDTWSHMKEGKTGLFDVILSSSLDTLNPWEREKNFWGKSYFRT